VICLSYEKQTKSFSFNAFLVRGPIKFLNDMLKEDTLNSIILGVIISASYLEAYGKDKLKEYFTGKTIPIKPFNFDNPRSPSLSKIIEWIWGFEIVDNKKAHIKGYMDDVRDERNNVIHHLRYPDAIDKNKARETIKKAIECLTALEAS